jgi:medium-chain acyl-[acyl-carrier-protein] hydrolase
VFRTWPDGLPASIEVLPVQLPGHGTRIAESPARRIASLVHPLADALEAELDRPFALFGHSMGALFSFELARELRRRGRVPERLLVAGWHAPHLHFDSPIHRLPDAEFLERVRVFHAAPSALLDNDELMQVMLPVLRADFEACETYGFVSEAPLECPITGFCGAGDTLIVRQLMEGWSEHSRWPFALHTLPGDHFFLHGAEAELLGLIADAVDPLPTVQPVAVALGA